MLLFSRTPFARLPTEICYAILAHVPRHGMDRRGMRRALVLFYLRCMLRTYLHMLVDEEVRDILARIAERPVLLPRDTLVFESETYTLELRYTLRDNGAVTASYLLVLF